MSATAILTRDVNGLLGLALLSARGLGSHLSWLLPLSVGVGSFFVPRPGGILAAALAWPLAEADDAASWRAGWVLLLAGVVVFVASGEREARRR
jgi:hypothetical protein